MRTGCPWIGTPTSVKFYKFASSRIAEESALTTGTVTLPLPRWEETAVVVEPPGDEPGSWAGAPSSIVADGWVYLAYRLRLPIGEGRGIANVVARSHDGVAFTVLAEVGKDQFGAESLERPAIVRTPAGRWRLYVS